MRLVNLLAACRVEVDVFRLLLLLSWRRHLMLFVRGERIELSESNCTKAKVIINAPVVAPASSPSEYCALSAEDSKRQPSLLQYKGG